MVMTPFNDIEPSVNSWLTPKSSCHTNPRNPLQKTTVESEVLNRSIYTSSESWESPQLCFYEMGVCFLVSTASSAMLGTCQLNSNAATVAMNGASIGQKVIRVKALVRCLTDLPRQ